MASRTLEVTFIGNAKPVTDAFDKVGSSGGTLQGKISGLGGAFGTFAGVLGGVVAGNALPKLAGFFTDAAKGAAEDQAATERLHQTFRNYAEMVGATPDTFQRLNDLLDERIKIGQDLAFTDDDVRDSFNKLLTATDDSSEATKRQQAAMDLARGAHISLGDATKILSKLSGENVEVLKKMGITIGENATEADALAAVQARFGGQAEAYAKSTAGQFEQTKIRMGELKEQIGAQLLPVMTKIGTVLLEDVVPKLEQFAGYWSEHIAPKISEFWEQKAKPVLKAIGDFIETTLMPKVKENFAKFQDYYDSDINPALDNIKAAIEGVVRFLIEHWGQIEPFVRPIFIAIQTAATVALGAIKLAIDILGGDWRGAWRDMQDIAQAVFDGIVLTVGAVKDQVLVAVGLISDGWSGIANGIETAFRAAINEVIGWINKVIEAYNKIPLAPNVPTVPTVGGGGGSAPAPQGPVYGPATPSYGPETPGGTPYQSAVLALERASESGGMGNPSRNWQDPRGVTLTANDILNMRANPPTVTFTGPVYMTDQSSANRTMTNALRAAGAV